MAKPERRLTDSVPPGIEQRLRALCLDLPEAYEEHAWVGTRWMVRKRTFVHVLGVDVDGPTKGEVASSVVMTFRSSGEELDVLAAAGHPYYRLGWGRDAMGMVLDDTTDWDEVGELVIESYCVLAPQKLVARVVRPDPVDAGEG